MNSHSVLWLLSIKIFITNYTAPDRYQQRKEGAKYVLTTLFPWRAIYNSNSALVNALYNLHLPAECKVMIGIVALCICVH